MDPSARDTWGFSAIDHPVAAPSAWDTCGSPSTWGALIQPSETKPEEPPAWIHSTNICCACTLLQLCSEWEELKETPILGVRSFLRPEEPWGWAWPGEQTELPQLKGGRNQPEKEENRKETRPCGWQMGAFNQHRGSWKGAAASDALLEGGPRKRRSLPLASRILSVNQWSCQKMLNHKRWPSTDASRFIPQIGERKYTRQAFWGIFPKRPNMGKAAVSSSPFAAGGNPNRGLCFVVSHRKVMQFRRCNWVANLST